MNVLLSQKNTVYSESSAQATVSDEAKKLATMIIEEWNLQIWVLK